MSKVRSVTTGFLNFVRKDRETLNQKLSPNFNRR